MGFRKSVQKLFSRNNLGAKVEKKEQPPVKEQAPKEMAKMAPKETTSKEMTPNQVVVAEFVRLVNSHQEDFSSIFDARADVLFKDAPMTLDGFLGEWAKIFRSFPDFYLRVEGGIDEQPDGTVIAVLNAGGTHTGTPYSFGPFPEIEATGIKVANDPEYVELGSVIFTRINSLRHRRPLNRRVCFTIEDGKIKKFAVESVGGELTGPPGLYTQIGGLIF